MSKSKKVKVKNKNKIMRELGEFHGAITRDPNPFWDSFLYLELKRIECGILGHWVDACYVKGPMFLSFLSTNVFVSK